MFRYSWRNVQEIHPDRCCGTKEDVSILRTNLFLASTSTNSVSFHYAVWKAARAGHRKCLRFLLRESNLQFCDQDFLVTITFLTTHSDSLKTLDLGLRLMDRLSARNRHRTLVELLDSMVVKDNDRNLQHLMDRLGEWCPTQTRFVSSRPGMVFRHNTPMTAVWWKRHECLRLLLRQGAVVDSSRLQNSYRMTLEEKEEVSLILAWTKTIRYIFRNDVRTEVAILHLLFEFGSNLWERGSEGMCPLNMITIFPLDDLDTRQSAPEKRAVVAQNLQRLMASPRSLLSACRLTITRAMGPGYMRKVDQLGPLPRTLVSYLKFEEMKLAVTEDGEILEEEDSSDDENFDQFLVQLKEKERVGPKGTKRRRSSDF